MTVSSMATAASAVSRQKATVLSWIPLTGLPQATQDRASGVSPHSSPSAAAAGSSCAQTVHAMVRL